jgi:hypothetical protein
MVGNRSVIQAERAVPAAVAGVRFTRSQRHWRGADRTLHMSMMLPLSLVLLAVVTATSPPIVLAPHRTVRPGVDAFPRVARAAREPQRRLNPALDRLDERVRQAARDCLAEGGRARDGYDRLPLDADELACRDQVAGEVESGPIAMPVWLDAEREGLEARFDQNHARQVCSRPVVIPAAVLRREGASPRLLKALAAAHAPWKAQQ